MNSQLTVPDITLRSVKGAPLTNNEIDGNFKIFRDFCNSLAQLFGVALNTDGTLNPDVVKEINVVARNITRSKLAFKSAFVTKDTGSSNAYTITFDPVLASYENELLFFVQAANDNTGPSTLRVGTLDSIPIKKLGGIELVSGDIKKKSVFAVAYFDGVFHLLASSGEAANATAATQTNFTGLTKYEPDDVNIPADGFTTTFLHALNQIPSVVVVRLVCTADDNGFVAGQLVPIEDVTTQTGERTFTVTIDGTNIVVRRNEATGYSNEKLLALDTKWQLQVRASKTYNEATNLFPAVDLMSAFPDGAISYGQYLFWFARGREQDKTYIHKLDMQTGIVPAPTGTGTPQTAGQNFQGVNPAPFRFQDGKDYLVWTCDKGLYVMPLQAPDGTWSATQRRSESGSQTNSASRTKCKPIWVDETDQANPIFFVAGSDPSVKINEIPCRKILTLSASDTAYENPLDLTNVGIKDIAGFNAWHPAASEARVLLFQYNPVKKRIYVVTNETGLLDIFQLVGTAGAYANNDISAFWANASRYTYLGYVKSIAIGGYGGSWTNQSGGLDYAQNEKIAVDFDLTTGEERAICWTRGGGVSTADDSTPNVPGGLPGSVTRIPWREG